MSIAVGLGVLQCCRAHGRSKCCSTEVWPLGLCYLLKCWQGEGRKYMSYTGPILQVEVASSHVHLPAEDMCAGGFPRSLVSSDPLHYVCWRIS